MNKIQEYVNMLLTYGYNIQVEINGLLGVVRNNNEIIFTTVGGQSPTIIETFLSGMIYSLYSVNHKQK